MFDPKTRKITMVDLCFSTHHLQFDKTGHAVVQLGRRQQ